MTPVKNCELLIAGACAGVLVTSFVSKELQRRKEAKEKKTELKRKAKAARKYGLPFLKRVISK